MIDIELKLWLILLTIIFTVPFLLFMKFAWTKVYVILINFYIKFEHKKTLLAMKQQLIKKGLKQKLIVDEQEDETKKSKKEDVIKNKLERLKIEAIACKEKGDIENYEKKLVEGLSYESTNLEFIKMLGNLYFSIGNTTKALPLLKKILEQEINEHKTIWQIGLIYLERQDYETAKLLVNKSIQIKPDNPKYYVSLAEIYYNCEELENAIKIMDKVLKLRPNSVKYLLSTGILFEELGDKPNARRYYMKVLELDHTNDIAKEKMEQLG